MRLEAERPATVRIAFSPIDELLLEIGQTVHQACNVFNISIGVASTAVSVSLAHFPEASDAKGIILG